MDGGDIYSANVLDDNYTHKMDKIVNFMGILSQ